MSSHHVIREKQEPALLVLSLDDFDDDLLGQLLEWSPTVITTPDTAEQLIAFGIKVDWIISNITEEDMQSDVKIIPQEKDPILITALKYLVAQGYPAVNIVTGDLKVADYSPFVDRIDLVILSHGKRIYTVTSGFNKWKPAGEIISILTPSPTLKVTGLEIAGDDLYKTMHDGFFTLHFDEPFLFVAEDL